MVITAKTRHLRIGQLPCENYIQIRFYELPKDVISSQQTGKD